MRVFVLVLLLANSAASAGGAWPEPDIPAAMAQGKDAGSGVNQARASAGISPATGSMLPGYGTTAPETSYFGGGSGVLGPYSGAKKTDCASTPAATPALQGQCDAINQMAKQTGPHGKPPITITASDPLLVAGRPVQADPSTVIGTVSSTYSACTTRTVTNPGDFVLEQCSDWLSSSAMNCAVGQVVKLDPHYVYQCQESLASAASNSCFVPRVVEVDTTYHYQCQTSDHSTSSPACTRRAIVTVSGGGSVNLPSPTALGSATTSATTSVTCDAWNVAGGHAIRVYCTHAVGPFDLAPGQTGSGTFAVPSGRGMLWYNLAVTLVSCDGTLCQLKLVQTTTAGGTLVGSGLANIIDPASVPAVSPLASMPAVEGNGAGSGVPPAEAFADGSGTGYYLFSKTATFIGQPYYRAHTTTGGATVVVGGTATGHGYQTWYAYAGSCAAGTCVVHYPDVGSHTFNVPQPWITGPYTFTVVWDNSECTTYEARRP